MTEREWLAQRLQPWGQLHLLDHWDELTGDERNRLRQGIESLDLEQISGAIRADESAQPPAWQSDPSRIQPPPAIRLDEPAVRNEEARQAGESALRDSQIGLLIVAGGQGSRLGFDHPKGLFPIGPVSGRSLFQMLFDQLIAIQQRYDCTIPVYVMTSPATDEETHQYFQQQQYFTLPPDQIHVFCQGTLPAVDLETGRILMADRASLALSPDGHGGMLEAIDRSGGLSRATAAGVSDFFYCQIDNPLVPICDPTWIGHHLLRQSELTTVAVRKERAAEPVGNVVRVDERVEIIEYSEFDKLPQAITDARDPQGQLQLWAGNIAVHMIARRFLQRMVDQNYDLPLHLARKAVAHYRNGERFQPTEINAIKLERFIFDLLPKAKRPLVIEGHKQACFAPVKNSETQSQTDTPTTARRAIVAQHKKWLVDQQIEVGDYDVEINPCWAAGPHDVSERFATVTRVTEHTYWDAQGKPHCDERTD